MQELKKKWLATLTTAVAAARAQRQDDADEAETVDARKIRLNMVCGSQSIPLNVYAGAVGWDLVGRR